MPIFHWGQGWESLHNLERQMDRLLESMRSPFQGIRFEAPYPAMNVWDLPDEFLVTAEFPGVAAEHVEVTFSNGVLTLAGQRLAPDGVPEGRFRRHERFWGKWQRSLSISDRVNGDAIAAELTDGILKVHLPKLEEQKPRQIPVQSAD